MRLHVVAAACLLAGCALDVVDETAAEAQREESIGGYFYSERDSYADPCRYGAHVNGVAIPAYCVEYHGDRGDPERAPSHSDWRTTPHLTQDGLR